MGCVSGKKDTKDTKVNQPIQQKEEVVVENQNQKQQEIKAQKPPSPPPQKKEIQQDDLHKKKIKEDIQINSQVQIIEFSGLTLEIPEKITVEKQFSILISGQINQWLLYLSDVNEIEILLTKLKIKTPYTYFKIGQLYSQEIKQIQATILKSHQKYTLLTQIFNKYKENFDEILNELLIGTSNQPNKSSPANFLILNIKAYHIIGCIKANQQINQVIIKSVSKLINSIQDVREMMNQEYPFIVDLKINKNHAKNFVQPFLEDFYNDTCEKIRDQNYNHKDFSNNYLNDLYEKVIVKIDESKFNVEEDYDDLKPQNANKYESYKVFSNKRK